MRTANHPRGAFLPLPAMDDSEFRRWAALLEARTGVATPPERKTFLVSGLRQRMRETGHASFHDYYRELTTGVRGAIEWSALIDHLTVHETHFFRHPPSLHWIRDVWLPDWLRSSMPGQPLHALSIGCATGEEAYTLAMLLETALAQESPKRRFGITATDVAPRVLITARQALYPLPRLQEIPAALQATATEPAANERFRIVERLRRRIGFACVNLLDTARTPLQSFDLIYCQNVLIYFARARRGELLDGLVESLNPHGLLVLGPGEAIGWSHPQLKRTGGRRTLMFKRLASEAAA